MRKRLIVVLVSLGLALASISPALAEYEVQKQPIPGMSHERCLQVQQTEQSGRIEMLCTWGPDHDGSGIRIEKRTDQTTPQ